MSDVQPNRWMLKAPRQCALSQQQRVAVFGAICAFGALLAFGAVTLFRAWAVVPFTGLELLAVGAAFWWWERHAEDFEAIVLEGNSLIVLRQVGRHGERYELPAAWAQVSRERAPSGWGQRRRLIIACKGKAVTFGEFLNEAGVNECQRLVKAQLKSAWKTS